MRERHLPRVCRSCQAPMARQEATCWRCGTRWASEDGPRTRLKVIAGGGLAEDGWANEGGNFDDYALSLVAEP